MEPIKPSRTPENALRKRKTQNAKIKVILRFFLYFFYLSETTFRIPLWVCRDFEGEKSELGARGCAKINEAHDQIYRFRIVSEGVFGLSTVHKKIQ